ncbi:MAG: lipopolysaccharide heptosyltransferase family protein [Alphaproteobacteria bacterium]|nr:MAG: lipopolysaccharide heptosyltransferase family protein [Alphaproteobacteria bacterium]
MPNKILVIKHSALGDFVLATGPMKAIRAHHPNAHITLLTTKTFAGWGRDCGWFNDVIIDSRPPISKFKQWLDLRADVRGRQFDMVYDLQTSSRTNLYFYFWQPHKMQWNGAAKLASHPHTNPRRAEMHTTDRHREQLALSGIANVPPPNLDWMRADISKFNLNRPYVLLVPGGSAHRPQKRWPVEYYIKAVEFINANGVIPVLLGATADLDVVEPIAAACPYAVNLLNKTNFAEIVELGRHAAAAIGNDTGPMHMVAPTGCPSIVLFSHDSDPARCAPKGPGTGQNVTILREFHLKDLQPDAVLAILGPLLTNNQRHNGVHSASSAANA